MRKFVLRVLALTGIGVVSLASPLRAEVVFDGTVGPGGALSGNFDIPDSFGTQVGSNLFHSFSTFNINTGESATFTSSFTGVTDNVIGRVTGGSLSTIDGLLASTIPGAAIWLINPNGVVFGDNASLSVPGAVHVSTADYLLLEDGGRFDATNLGDTVLTMANPVSFGFLSATPASISAGASTLDVVDGATISLIGGDLTLTNTNINAPRGRINLASAASAGQLSLDPGGIGVNGVTNFGDVNLTTVNADTTADSGGNIFIRGGQFFMDSETFINANTLGIDPTDSGGDISVNVDDVFILNGSQFSTTTFGAGDGGTLRISATGNVHIEGNQNGNPAGAFANVRDGATGQGGNIEITANNLDVIEGGLLGAVTFGAGDAGSILLDIADTVFIRNLAGFDGAIFINSLQSATGGVGNIEINATNLVLEEGGRIQANTSSSGASGSIMINVDSLDMTGGSQLAATTFGEGPGGSVIVNANDISLFGFRVNSSGFAVPTGLFADNNWPGTGAGGEVIVNTNTLSIVDGAQVSAGTGGLGPGGDVTVSALDNIFIDGEMFPLFTGIFANTFWIADAGTITVTTPELNIIEGGFIQAGSFSNNALAFGNGNDIVVNVDNLRIDSGFISTSTWTAGNAGTVTINASGTATLQNSTDFVFSFGNAPVGGFLASTGSFFTSSDATGNGGNIIVNASELILLDGGAITAQTITTGDAGSITINADIFSAHSNTNMFTGILNNTGIGTGNAGSISMDVNNMSVTGLATIQAATLGLGGVGNAGAINIAANNLTLADGGSISTQTQSSGAGGTIDIDVSDTFIASDGDQSPVGSNVSSASSGSGNGGTLRIAAENLIIDDNGVISASTSMDGNGGDLVIEGRIISISDGGTVTASATGTGNAGTVIVVAVDDLTVTDAAIETSSVISAGGNIDIQVGQTLFLNEGGNISAAAGGVTATDDGGNILIDPVFVILRESSILATANAGNGGNIGIQAGSFIIDANSVIDASSQTGLDGRITIDSVNNIYGSVLLLETPSMNVPDVITQKCVAAAFQDRSSLTVEQRDAFNWSPQDYVPSPLRSASAERVAATSPDECRFSLIVENAINET
jgi:filamentous hemagglutinin family protein